MAFEWIKMRRGMRHDPKVIAMARRLCESPPIKELIGESSRVMRHSPVTFAFVTRVTVCGLLDVWAALNSTIKSDGQAPFMTLQDIDDIAEIPDFGKAMESVGWVTLQDDGGLVFPNFAENNTPTKSRGKAPKSDAQRAKEYRERKKAENQSGDPVTTSRHVTGDKIRLDSTRERARAEQAQTIVSSYPRREKTASALRIVEQHLSEGEDFEAMLSGTKAAAAVIRTLPSGSQNRYVPGAESFFLNKRWQDDPETLKRQGDPSKGQGRELSDEELQEQLGGRFDLSKQ